MKQKVDHTVTEIKKDISILDWFDWTSIGLATIGVILFIILILEMY
jgi:hypothetical protein